MSGDVSPPPIAQPIALRAGSDNELPGCLVFQPPAFPPTLTGYVVRREKSLSVVLDGYSCGVVTGCPVRRCIPVHERFRSVQSVTLVECGTDLPYLAANEKGTSSPTRKRIDHRNVQPAEDRHRCRRCCWGHSGLGSPARYPSRCQCRSLTGVSAANTWVGHIRTLPGSRGSSPTSVTRFYLP